jgi:AcrR family transcriptional regulator
MPHDSASTRRRLLNAAIEEFSVHGLAGGRVQVIADNAKANKQAIYAYYGSKEGLFLAAFADRIGRADVRRICTFARNLATAVLGFYRAGWDKTTTSSACGHV